MGKIRVQDLAKMMEISNQDLVFKLKSLGVRVEGDDAHIDTDIIQAILAGKKLPHPGEVLLRSGSVPTPAADVRRGEARTPVEKAEPKLKVRQSSEKGDELVGLRRSVDDLQQSIAYIENNIWGMKDQMSTQDSLMARLEEDVSDYMGGTDVDVRSVLVSISHRLDKIESVVGAQSRTQEIAEAITKRVLKAQQDGLKIQKAKFRSPLSAAELVSRLRACNFYLPQQIASDLIDKLESRKVVVLEGVPGTGKSQLARYLAEFLLPNSSALEKYTQVSVFPEATVSDSIGGLRMIEGHFVPQFGWITEAVLKCIEAGGFHWLILDEINRGDISNLLGPALDALEPAREGVIEHPNLFPNRNHQAGGLPMPGTFRIIGTRNPFDNDTMFDFTHALSRRISTVAIAPLASDEEGSLLRVVIRRKLQELGVGDINIDEHEKLGESLRRMRQLVADIRTLAFREPSHLYRKCELGTALVIELAERLCRRFAQDLPEDVDEILDSLFASMVFDQPQQYSRYALKALKEEVLVGTWAARSLARITEGLK